MNVVYSSSLFLLLLNRGNIFRFARSSSKSLIIIDENGHIGMRFLYNSKPCVVYYCDKLNNQPPGRRFVLN